MQTSILNLGERAPIDADHVLVSQDLIAGVVTVTGAVRDTSDTDCTISLKPRSFRPGGNPADNYERALQFAQDWAKRQGVDIVHPRKIFETTSE